MLSIMRPTLISRFNPNLMTPEALENIFVQRQKLAEQIVELIRESATTPSKHYTLLIGPRGIGKTHFISLVYHRIRKMDDLDDRLLIAWVREEEWGISSFLDLLLRILQAIEKEYNDRELGNRIESLYQLTPENAERTAGELLKEIIGNRTLLLLMENLDEVFAGLDDEGQKQLRAYLQENAFCTILATSQSLFNGVKLQTSPFYGFFRIRHLKDLTLDEAVQLLAKVAKLQGDRELESFIQTPTGRDRIKTVHYLAGGNPRVYIILSAFLTRQSLDDLVEAFMAMLDDLTPYYQDRMKCLSPQQRKIVDLLCDRRHAVTVKEIAQRCFITHQTASSQLKDLREKGYVISEAIGRESYYELRETLMRFCVEVKKQRGEPIRLFVDFLRIWYTREELQQRWERCLASSHGSSTLQVTSLKSSLRLEESHHYQQLSPLYLEQEYLRRALEASDSEEDPRVAAYIKEFLVCYIKKGFVQGLRLTEKLVEIRGQALDWLLHGLCLDELKYYEQAIAACDRALSIQPDYDSAWLIRGIALGNLGQLEEEIASFDRALAIKPGYHHTWLLRGIAFFNLGQLEEAIASFDRALAIKADYHDAWLLRGIALFNLGQLEEAIASYDRALAIQPDLHEAWNDRGIALNDLGQLEEAIASYKRALAIKPDSHEASNNWGVTLLNLGQLEEAIAAYDRALVIKPDFQLTWNNRGIAFLKLNRFEDASTCFDRVIELGATYSGVFFNRAIAILGFDRWDEGITALENAIKQIQNKDEITIDDTELIIRIVFKNTQDSVIWKSRLISIIQFYDKYEVLSPLGQGLVKSIPALMPETISDKTARTWLELWQELAKHYPEFQIPLRLLNAAVRYKETKGDRRVLLELAIEERQLLEPLLGGSEPINMK